MRIFIIGRGRARAGLPSHLNPAAAIPMLGNKKPKIGYADQIRKMLAQRKKVWQANGLAVAVYSVNASGPAQFAVVIRFKQGLKEKTPGFRKPFKPTYEGIFGEDSFDEHVQSIRQNSSEIWSELLFLRKDLSSK